MELQEKMNNLIEMRDIIQRPVFQEMLVKPMREYQDKLKNAYDCKSLSELATLKGKKDGSDKFFKILKEFSTEFKNTKNELESHV